MNRILLVDDESSILSALKREIMANGNDYEIEAFVSPLEALARAKNTQFDLVVSDCKMPEMDGVTFLNEFQKIQPDAARIMLSGHVDLAGLMNSINQTHIYRFISKPWNAQEMISALKQALDYRNVILENRRLAAEYESKHGALPEFYLDKDCHILVVDGDPEELRSISIELKFNSQFRDLYEALYREADPVMTFDKPSSHFNVETTTSPLEALELGAQRNYDLVIADHHMAEMDGITFLQSFRELQRDAATILLSNHVDMQTLSQAINKVGIYNVIVKPWNSHQLRSAVTQASAYQNILLDNQRLAKELEFGVDGITV
jgi:two-component system probable response regulator PhcQ